MEYYRKEPEVILPQKDEPELSFENDEPQALCAHFVRGACRFGETCRNLHMDRDSAMNSNDYAKSYKRIVDASNKPPGDGKKQVCRFFTKAGHCKFGKDCNFFHPKDDGNTRKYSNDGNRRKYSNDGPRRGNGKHSKDNYRRKTQTWYSKDKPHANFDLVCPETQRKCTIDPTESVFDALKTSFGERWLPTVLHPKSRPIIHAEFTYTRDFHVIKWFQNDTLEANRIKCIQTAEFETKKKTLFSQPEMQDLSQVKFRKSLCNTMILIDSNNEVLVTQRPLNESLPLSWVFPGGELDLGETPEEGSKRETLEECGVDIDGNSLGVPKPYMFIETWLWTRQGKCTFLNFFIWYCKLDRPKTEITLKLQTDEVAAAEWVPMDILQKCARGDDVGPDYNWLVGEYPNQIKQGLTGNACLSVLELPAEALAKNCLKKR
jgi:mutator protein MutT